MRVSSDVSSPIRCFDVGSNNCTRPAFLVGIAIDASVRVVAIDVGNVSPGVDTPFVGIVVAVEDHTDR